MAELIDQKKFFSYGIAKELGFENVSADLIAGMLEETDENWTDCVNGPLIYLPIA